jgi:hypothetical protein
LLLGAARLFVLALLPAAIMIVPVTLLLGQLSLWYQQRPLQVGEEAVVTMTLAGDIDDPLPDVRLEPTDALEKKKTFGPVRVLSKREVCWNVCAHENGRHRLVFDVGGQTVEKELAVGDGYMRVSARRPAWSWTDAVLYPGEPPFRPDSPVRSIEVEYPERSTWKLFGAEPGVVYWFVSSMVAALCFRRLLNVKVEAGARPRPEATRMTPEIIVVSGLPRSGTSLMMQMLDRGGVEVVTDHIRAADGDNPRGYYEFEPVKAVKRDASWLPATRGKAFKMVSPLLYDLPADETYRVLFMERDLEEVLASQEKMLARLGCAATPREEMRRAYALHLERLCGWLSLQPNMTVLRVGYSNLLERPHEQAERVAAFVAAGLDIERMANAVDQSLYRNRKASRAAGRA